MNATLFTIGHADHSFDQFISMLKQHEVDVICDVRSSPYSRRATQYNRETLKTELAKHRIKYVFLGEELGGRPKDPFCYENGKVNYERQAQTSDFKRGIDRLIQGLQKYRPALLCAEKDPITCHRTVLIARNLRSPDLNIEIDHILPNGSLEPHSTSESRMIKATGLEPTLFSSSTDLASLLNRAYEIQGERIAYQERQPDRDDFISDVS